MIAISPCLPFQTQIQSPVSSPCTSQYEFFNQRLICIIQNPSPGISLITQWMLKYKPLPPQLSSTIIIILALCFLS
jgi:hypothetical protein